MATMTQQQLFIKGCAGMASNNEILASAPQADYRKIEDKALAVHECGHAVCALANGLKVLKVQNGVRLHFTLYENTFPSIEVRKIVAMAGPVAESGFLKEVGFTSRDVGVCSAGDVAHLLLGCEESPGTVQKKFTEVTRHEKDARVAALTANLDLHLMDGKDLPDEFQYLLGLIRQARETLMAHRNLHDALVAALFDKGGVLRKSDIQRIWNATLN
jgi:hypothetical protein